MRIFTIAILVSMTGLGSLDLCRGATTNSGRFSLTQFGPMPEQFNAVLAPDKRHLAYVVTNSVVTNAVTNVVARKQVLLNGRPVGPEFTETFVERTVTFNPQSTRLAFAIVRETTNCTSCGPRGKWQAVIDGQVGPEFDVVHNIVFSPDGKRTAYGAILKSGNQDQWLMVVDGKETLIPYAAISRDSPAFTPDNARLVYIAKKGEKAVVVVNGEEGPAHDKIQNSIPEFSSDGKHIAYVARDFGPLGGRDKVMLDGKPGPEFDHIPAQSLHFSPDGRRHAYGGQNGGVVPQDPSTWVVVVDGNSGPEFDQVDHIRFSPDGKHVAYKAKQGGQWRFVIDGELTPAYAELTEGFPVFSSDSRRIAYGFKSNNTWNVFVRRLDFTGNTNGLAGRIGGDFDGGVGMITFSPDGQHLAFAGAKAGRRMIVVDGSSAPPWGGRSWDMVRSLTFSPDGKRVAAEVGTRNRVADDKWELVVDGQTQDFPTLLAGSLVFSTDSKHFAFKVTAGDKQRLILDGQAGPEYKSIGQILPTADNGFESLVIGDNLSRVVWTPPQSRSTAQASHSLHSSP